MYYSVAMNLITSKYLQYALNTYIDNFNNPHRIYEVDDMKFEH